MLINQLETGGGGQIFWKDKKIKNFIEIAETLTGSGFKRCRGTESNRRHEDFQTTGPRKTLLFSIPYDTLFRLDRFWTDGYGLKITLILVKLKQLKNSKS